MKDVKELTLVDYVKIILKRKICLFVFLLIAIIAAVTITLSLPKKYESGAIVKIGKFQNEPVISKEEIIKLFRQRPYLKKVLEVLEIETSERNIAFIDKAISVENKTTEDLITIETRGKSPEEAKTICNAVTSVILTESKRNFEKKEEILGKRISALNNSLSDFKKEIEIIEDDINRFDPPKNEAEGIALQAYLTREGNIKYSIKDVENNLENIAIQKMKDTNSFIASPSYLSEQKVSPSLKINLIISVLLGFFFGLIWIFILEWWQNNKNKLRK